MRIALMRMWAAVAICALMAGCAAQREAAERKARLVQLHTQLGAGYMQRNQYDVAQQELSQALAIDADAPQANNVMALLQIRLKDPVKAEAHFKRALAADPRHSEVLNNYGTFLCEQGRMDEAEDKFKQALTDPLYPTPELANLNAGLCLMRKPAPRAAEKYFRAALAIHPRLAPALLQMARLSFDSGQTLAARGYMQRYLEVAKDSPESLALAVDIERVLGNKDMQASYALRLSGKYPDSPEAKRLKAATSPSSAESPAPRRRPAR